MISCTLVVTWVCVLPLLVLVLEGQVLSLRLAEEQVTQRLIVPFSCEGCLCRGQLAGGSADHVAVVSLWHVVLSLLLWHWSRA